MRHLDWQQGTPVKLPAQAALSESVHVFDPASVDAVNAALIAGRPLLVRGEPGTGKSQLARAAAVALGRAFISQVVDARTEARDLMWSFDAVARLAEAQVQGALGVRDEDRLRENLRAERFLTPGPLWWVFDWRDAERQRREGGGVEPSSPAGWEPAAGAVLLLDEIDKADSSVPNGLLECLGQGRFPALGGKVVSWQAQEPPLILITTNEERALPDPFLRRCLVLHLGWPTDRESLVAALVERGKAHFPACSPQVLEEAARLLAQDREAVAERGLCPPGGAEYLDLLRVLEGSAPSAEARQLELLARVGRFALQKHPAEPAW